MLTRTLKIHGKVGANTMETHSYFIQNVGGTAVKYEAY